MKLRRLSTRDRNFERKLAALTRYEAAQDPAVQKTVRGILAEVRKRGDAAVRAYTKKFDGVTPREYAVSRKFLDAIPRDQADALRIAYERIRAFHERQLQTSWDFTDTDGTRLGQQVSPLERVGLYVPGGKAAYPSSVLMNAVPAKVAGVRELIMASPNPNPLVLAAAALAGVDRVIGIGGAQAIAALAYGTKTIPRVDKIVGPGNAYVAAAKALVAPDCAIDFFAGPSEIAIVSSTGDPAWIAADLLAQAEHDPDARAILFTSSRRLSAAVSAAVARQMPGSGPAATSLQSNGGVVLARSQAEAIALCQRMAPEHVVCDSASVARRLTRAGTVFVGRYSAQAAGDYATGSNHVLPTSGAAASRGGLSPADFVRVATVQQLSASGLRRLAPAVIALAEAEGLQAHADSIRIRVAPKSGRPGQRR